MFYDGDHSSLLDMLPILDHSSMFECSARPLNDMFSSEHLFDGVEPLSHLLPPADEEDEHFNASLAAADASIVDQDLQGVFVYACAFV